MSPSVTPLSPAVAARLRDSDDLRYAIYFAPRPDSAWWQFGCEWLGRDPITNRVVAGPAFATWTAADLARIRAAPRRYGFHATLKPPFRLAPGHTVRDINLQAANLACSLNAVQLPSLQLMVIDGFVALTFAHADARIVPANAIAAQCVSCFDNLRARPNAAELSRRHAAGLTPRQLRLLAEWGYPYVFEEFRFHLTLTGRLPPAELQHVIDTLQPAVTALSAEPPVLDALSIYMQPARDAPFIVTRRYGFDGSVEIYHEEEND